jgi:hypothetical protein
MSKISYTFLQKKYPGKVVILDKAEKKILAVGKKFEQLISQLKQKKSKKQIL